MENVLTLANKKSLVLSYAGLAAYIEGRRDKEASSRTLELNTVALYINGTNDGSIAVRFHQTDIIIYHSDGSFTLYSGGWHTQTTADRLDAYNPAGLRFGFKDRILYVWDTHEPYETRQRIVFFEGMHYVPCENGYYRLANPPAVSPEQSLQDYKKVLYKRIRYYTNAISVEQVQEAVSDLSGDCWHCQFRDTQNLRAEPLGVDHLWQHMRESYYPGTLFLNAFRYKGANEGLLMYYLRNGNEERIKKIVTIYLRAQLITHPELLDAERAKLATR